MCNNSNIEGTIVFCHKEKKKYVIPLCSDHKNSEKELEICKQFILVEYV